MAQETGSGPVVVGYDGSPASERALREAAALLSVRQALVVVVWEAGLAFEALELPTSGALPPVPMDIRVALEVDRAMYEGAQRLAAKGAALARELGLEAEGLAVADEVTVAATLIRLVKERNGRALVVGARGHGRLGELLLGSTSRDVIRDGICPVLVVREEGGGRR